MSHFPTTSRSDRTTAVIAPGEAQGFAQIIIDDVVVPPANAADYEIEVGLGTRNAAKAPRTKVKHKKAKPAAEAAPAAAGEAAQ